MGVSSYPFSRFSGESEFVGVRAYLAASQSLANSVETLVNWDSEVFDTHNFHDNSSNNTRFTVPAGKGGKYLASAHGAFDSNSTGHRGIKLKKNGINELWAVRSSVSANNFEVVPLTEVIDLQAGDYLELVAVQASGGALNFRGGLNDTGSFFQLFRLGPSATSSSGSGGAASYFTASGNQIRTDSDLVTSKLLAAEGAQAVANSYSAVIDEATTNYVTNPSFEADTAGWTADSPATLTRIISDKKIGAACGNMVFTAGTQIVWTSVAASAGQVWTGSFWFKGNSGASTVRIQLLAYDGGGATVGSSTQIQPTLSGHWQKFSLTHTCPASTATLRLRFISDGVFDSSADGVQLEQKSYATTYCDGSLGPGYAWTGTAHASASTRTQGFKYLGQAAGDSFYLGQGRLLALAVHQPTSDTIFTTTSTSFVDVDTTNLVLRFIAPPSGRVLVRLSANADTEAVDNRMVWNLRSGGADVSGTAQTVLRNSNNDRTMYSRVIGNLTPGTSYSYTWGWRTTGGTSRILLGAGEFGQGIMEVWEVPA